MFKLTLWTLPLFLFLFSPTKNAIDPGDNSVVSGLSILARWVGWSDLSPLSSLFLLLRDLSPRRPWPGKEPRLSPKDTSSPRVLLGEVSSHRLQIHRPSALQPALPPSCPDVLTRQGFDLPATENSAGNRPGPRRPLGCTPSPEPASPAGKGIADQHGTLCPASRAPRPALLRAPCRLSLG